VTGAAGVRQDSLRALDRCEAILTRHAVLEHGGLRTTLGALRRIVERGRLVRVALVGRRGSGKSSLVNAVASAPAAPIGDVGDATGSAARYVIRDVVAQRTVEWIDTPGLRAGGRTTRRDAVQAVLRATPCDVLLAPVTATEVDAGIDEDLDDLRAILAAQERAWDYRPTVIAVVTRADDLAHVSSIPSARRPSS
jgi:predicted GTPase